MQRKNPKAGDFYAPLRAFFGGWKLAVLLALAFVSPHTVFGSTAQGARAHSMLVGLGTAADQRPGDGELEELFESTIQTAYETLRAYAVNSGADLRFELSDFSTFYREDFPEVQIVDLTTMPRGRVIDMRRQTQSHAEVSEKGEVTSRRTTVQYWPEWRTLEPAWQVHPETAFTSATTLDQALSLRAEQDPIFRNTQAVTSYDVEVFLAGETRNYRAAVLWFKAQNQPVWDRFDLLVLDHVTQGVENALRERIPVEGVSSGSPQEGSKFQTRAEASLQPKAGCVPGTVSTGLFGEQGSGVNSHITGAHTAAALFSFNCTCDSGCRQSCSADVSSPTCSDGGLTADSCHKMGFDTAAESQSVINSTASCTAAFRCVQKSCLFCLCGVSVSVSILGGQVSFGGDVGAWSFQRKWSYSCPSCPPDVSGDPGGGLGGCSAGAQETTTTSVTLSAANVFTKLTHRSPMRQVAYPLHRVEVRDGESFIMDEWAVVRDGVVVGTSDPGFGRAVVDRDGQPVRGVKLVVQKPVHPMNERYVPEPGVWLKSSGLPGSLQGDGEIVAARVEFSPDKRADFTEILFASGPVDEEALRLLLLKRVGLVFATEKTHRAAAYVVVRVSADLDLLDAFTVLPQCCCGTEEPFCV